MRIKVELAKVIKFTADDCDDDEETFLIAAKVKLTCAALASKLKQQRCAWISVAVIGSWLI